MTATKLTAPQAKALMNLLAVGGTVPAYLENFRAAKINGNAVWGRRRKRLVREIVKEGTESYMLLTITDAGRAALEAYNPIGR